MEKELIQELRKLKEMYEEKIEEAQSIPHYEDQDSHDCMAFAYEEIVLDLVHLIERVVREPLERNDDIVPNAFAKINYDAITATMNIDELKELYTKLDLQRAKGGDMNLENFNSELRKRLDDLEKKQEPMKPTTERTRYGEVYDCNVCNCGLEPYNNFCPSCGQAIDWSE